MLEPNIHPTIAQALQAVRPEILPYPRTESYRDDYEPGTRDPQLLLQLDTMRAAAAKWPFPAAPIPPDRRAPPPTRPDPEPAPW